MEEEQSNADAAHPLAGPVGDPDTAEIRLSPDNALQAEPPEITPARTHAPGPRPETGARGASRSGPRPQTQAAPPQDPEVPPEPSLPTSAVQQDSNTTHRRRRATSSPPKSDLKSRRIS